MNINQRALVPCFTKAFRIPLGGKQIFSKIFALILAVSLFACNEHKTSKDDSNQADSSRAFDRQYKVGDFEKIK